MKKWKLQLFAGCVFGACISLAFFGCGSSSSQADEPSRFVPKSAFQASGFETESYPENYGTVTDTKTGCIYVWVWGGDSHGGGGMTPLLDEYGKPTGCHKVNSK